MNLTRRQMLAGLSLGSLASTELFSNVLRCDAATEEDRASGYKVEYSYPLDELIGDLKHSERGDAERESSEPHRDWYTEESRKRYGSWGPPVRTYPSLTEMRERPVAWLEQRVIAVAARFIGYGYQHHHIPDWDPPAGWPWKETCVGHNGRGFDCSNFTSFVYNQGFGIHMNSAVEHQAELREAIVNHEGEVPLRRIEIPENYEERKRVLRTGDLLYIRGKVDGPITHVVIWVGSIGRSQSGVPLVLDSHGSDVEDDAGKKIPCGVHLRPFRDHSWYSRCASHAHRVFG
jgi:cell wall-associated NlpC family hydrolase